MKKFLLFFGPLLIYILLVAAVLLFGGVTDTSLGLLSNLVAVGGLIVAFAATIIASWTRTDPQRQALYEAQLLAYREIYSVALQSSSALVDLVTSQGPETRAKLTNELNSDFYRTTRDHWVIYPRAVRDLIIDFETTFSDFVNAAQTTPADDRALMDLLVANSESLGLLVDGFRSSLGIEELHEDTLRLLGVDETRTRQG